MRALPLFALLSLAGIAPAAAQNAGIQKQLLLRNQQSDAFSLQLRQSQETLHVPSAPATEARQFAERQRLDALSEQQRLEVRPIAPPGYRAYERGKAEAERRAFRSPIVEVPVAPAPPAPMMQPALKGHVDVIEAPR